MVSFTEPNNSLPCFPVAAISAAKEIVSLKLAPYPLANSEAVAETSFLTFANSAEVVADKPP